MFLVESKTDSISLKHNTITVKPLKTDTPRGKPKCPSYRDVHLIELFQNF